MKAEKYLAPLVHVGGSILPNLRRANCLWWLEVITLSMTIAFWLVCLKFGGLHTAVGLITFAGPPACVFVLTLPLVFPEQATKGKLLVLFIREFVAEVRLEHAEAWLSRSLEEIEDRLKMSHV